MFYVVLIFLGLSLLLYLLFGGADFGAGILELFSGKSFRSHANSITYRAIGPVWEANHIWLIVMIVILFNGFPRIYATMSTYLHIPLVGMLIGIIVRGTAFAFRHYDVVKDGSQKYYSWMFMLSSLITPFFLGITGGALILGKIDPSAASYPELFIHPWLNLFSISVGIFTASIFAFLAAVFLIGETENREFRDVFLRKARNANLLTVITGALVFLSAELEGLGLLRQMLQAPLSLLALIAATLSLPLLWYALKQKKIWLPRLLAGFQLVMILFAWLFTQFPAIIVLKQEEALGISNTAAPERVMSILGAALLIAGALVIPALLYLLRAFKWKNASG